MYKVDNYKKIANKESGLALVGLNPAVVKLGADLVKRNFDVLSLDPAVDNDYRLKLEGASTKGLNECSVYYLNGGSTFMDKWEGLKSYAKLIGQNLSPSDWVIFSADLDPDMIEIILIPILEKESGLSVHYDFDVALLSALNFEKNHQNLSNAIKISHNLIIDKVAKLLGENLDPFQSYQLGFLDEKTELRAIDEEIKTNWVPTLNDMDSNLFQEFYVACVTKGFLDVYAKLKLSNERKVNYNRFFHLAAQFGLKHSTTSTSVNFRIAS